MAKELNYSKMIPKSQGGYEFPFSENAYGQLSPTVDVDELRDLIELARDLKSPSGQPYAYGRGTLGETIKVSSPDDYKRNFTTTARGFAMSLEQDEMHMKAMAADRDFWGLESNIFAKWFMTRGDKLNPVVTDEEKQIIINEFKERGLLEEKPISESWGDLAAYGGQGVMDKLIENEAIKRFHGRDLTDDEINRCVQDGLDNSAINEVREYVKDGKDFEKAFGTMSRLTWGRWVAHHRRFFDPKNLASIAVEAVTDPTNFIPYGLAFKIPKLIGRSVGRAVLASTATRPIISTAAGKTTQQALMESTKGLQYMARLGEEAATKPLTKLGGLTRGATASGTVGGLSGYTYAEIRNMQGVAEDTLSITMASFAFAAFLGGLGYSIKGKASPDIGIINDADVSIHGTRQLDDQSFNLVENSRNEIDVNRAAESLSNNTNPANVITNMTEADKMTFNERDRFVKRMQEVDEEIAHAELEVMMEGVSSIGDIKYKDLLDEKANILKQVDAIDAAYNKKLIEDRNLQAEEILKAKNIDDLRTQPRYGSDFRPATDADLNKFQRTYRNVISKFKALTHGGVFARENRPFAIDYAMKLLDIESGIPHVTPEGKIVSLSNSGKNLQSVNRAISAQVNYLVDDYVDKVRTRATELGKSITELEEGYARFLLSPEETVSTLQNIVNLDGKDMVVLAPLRQMTEILANMATDQSKVIGHGMLEGVNAFGERQLTAISPLLSTITHNPQKWMSAMVDSIKHNDALQKIAQKIEGYDSDSVSINKAVQKQASQIAKDECGDGLYTSVRGNKLLWEKFKGEKQRNWDYEKSKNSTFKSTVDKALDKLHVANRKIDELKSKTEPLTNKQKKQLATLEKDRVTLGAGDNLLGTTADEQVAAKVYEKILRDESTKTATGMIEQHFDTKHSGRGGAGGFDRPDHTEHRANYWDYYIRSNPDAMCLGDILDTRVDHVMSNYARQMTGRLAGNEVFGVKNFSEAMEYHGKWASDNMPYEHFQELPKKDQTFLRSAEAMIKGNYGISLKNRDSLGSNTLHASNTDAILESFRNFTALTKGGLFWFYNLWETVGAVQAYGAKSFLTSSPIMRNKLTRAMTGEKPNAKQLRMVENHEFGDQLNRSQSFNRIMDETAREWGGKNIFGKVVGISRWARQSSPFTKMQMATQSSPEKWVVTEVFAEMSRKIHEPNWTMADKKSWGGGFINKADVQRMGLSNDDLTDLMSAIKKVTYLGKDGEPLFKEDLPFDHYMTPKDRYSFNVMTNYVRNEVIQRASYADNFLYKGSNLSEFWDCFSQFKGFSVNSFRKKLIKYGNRIAYEGAYSEVGTHMGLNFAFGTTMSQLKTLLRYNTLSDDEVKKRYLMMNYGVESFGELDFSTLDPWMRIGMNGLLDSADFAGLQLGFSYFNVGQASKRTSGQGLSALLSVDGDGETWFGKPQDILFSNIPTVGKSNEIASSGNILLNWVLNPGLPSDIRQFRKDIVKFSRPFLPNDQFAISPMLKLFEGGYD